MYFQTQRDIWCHLITGTLPNASLLADAYQSWISLGKYGQNLARRKLEILSWTSTKSTPKSCSQRLFRNRCNYMIYSFEAWSALQDYQGACGVDSSSIHLSLIQEHEIIEMLGCFTKLLKEVKVEKQNHISHQPFANDPRCRSAPDKMIYGKCSNNSVAKNEKSGVKLDIAAAGDQKQSYSAKLADIKHKTETLHEEGVNNTEDFECPLEFNVDNSEEETSGSTQSGSEESESDETKSCDSEGTVNYEGVEIRTMPNPPKRFNSTDSLLTNDNSDGDLELSESEDSSRTGDIPASYSNSEDILTQLESVISGLSIDTFECQASADSSEENKGNRAKVEDEPSDTASSGFEFIERDDYFIYDDFDHDLPPRPSTS